MPGTSPEIATYQLKNNLTVHPIHQKKRCFRGERQKLIAQEVDKLLDVGFIMEVMYLVWLANMVMVQKSNSKQQMCVNFIDLNKNYINDSYPLLNIDHLVDSTTSFKYLSFLNANFGYYQILMHLDDKEKTTFISERGNFCYRAMSFGFKNAGATY